MADKRHGTRSLAVQALTLCIRTLLLAVCAITPSIRAEANAAVDARNGLLLSPSPSQGAANGMIDAPSRRNIVGGQEGLSSDWPFTVKLPGCTGSLIAPDWVLTAVHSVTAGDGVSQTGQADFCYDRSDPSSCLATRVRHKRVVSRPGYRHGEKYSPDQAAADVALIQLERELTNIQPVRLASIWEEARHLAFGPRAAVAVGWGLRARDGSISSPDVIHGVAVDVSLSRGCEERMSDSRPSILCTGSKDAGTAPGDSGGPLLVQTSQGWLQIGVTSGLRTSGDSITHWHTRVASHYEWINSVVGLPRHAGSHLPQFRDRPECPLVTEVAAGSSLVGDEKVELTSPPRLVTISQRFGIGAYEVTFDEWDACVADGGCPSSRAVANDAGWGRGRRPVIHVSWEDQQDYARWLTRKTGRRCRLPTEAEWEYAARAGIRQPWCFDPRLPVQVVAGASQTMPVGRHSLNPWGLLDVIGNVTEMVQDCWHDDLEGLPGDGSARLTGSCAERTGRGGDFRAKEFLDASFVTRKNISKTVRAAWIGFRVVREIDDDHGDTPSDATALELGAQVTGRIDRGRDIDVFRIEVDTVRDMAIYATGSLDIVGTLANSSGGILGTDDDIGEGSNFRIERRLQPGVYFVRVESRENDSTGSYTIRAEVARSGQPAEPTAETLLVAVLGPDPGVLQIRRENGGFTEVPLGNDRTEESILDFLDKAQAWLELAEAVPEFESVPVGYVVAMDGTVYELSYIAYSNRKYWYAHGVGNIGPSHEPRVITTFAGTGARGYGGPASQALLDWPTAVAADSLGNVYIADSNNHRVRAVRTVASDTAHVSGPADDHRDEPSGATALALGKPVAGRIDPVSDADVFRIEISTRMELGVYTTGNLDTLGTLTDSTGRALGRDDDGGVGANFRIAHSLYEGVYYVRVESHGSDSVGSYVIHAEGTVSGTPPASDSPAATISTAAGIGVAGGGGDGGSATNALLHSPSGVAVDELGNLYIADFDNHRVRRVDATGTIMAIAGTGAAGYDGDSGPATGALLNSPSGVAAKGPDNLYFAEWLHHRVSKLATTAMLPPATSPGPRAQPPLLAFQSVNRPLCCTVGLWEGGDGRYYANRDLTGQAYTRIEVAGSFIAEPVDAGHRIRTAAGSTAVVDSLARDAILMFPNGVAADSAGNVYVGDTGHQRVRKIDLTGRISTLAGSGDRGHRGDSPAHSAKFWYPIDVAADGLGNVLLADGHQIFKLDAAGAVTVLAGRAEPGYSGDGGPAAEARLAGPHGVAVDAAGNVYVADRGNNVVRKIDASGIITTIAGAAEVLAGLQPIQGKYAALEDPAGVGMDWHRGDVYVADRGQEHVFKISTSGFVTTFAGSGCDEAGFCREASPASDIGDNGLAIDADLQRVSHVAVDESGTVYVSAGNRVRRIDPESGMITTYETFPGHITSLEGDIWGNDLYVGSGRRIWRIDGGAAEDSAIPGEVVVIAGMGEDGFGGDGGPCRPSGDFRLRDFVHAQHGLVLRPAQSADTRLGTNERTDERAMNASILSGVAAIALGIPGIRLARGRQRRSRRHEIIGSFRHSQPRGQRSDPDRRADQRVSEAYGGHHSRTALRYYDEQSDQYEKLLPCVGQHRQALHLLPSHLLDTLRVSTPCQRNELMI